MNTNSEHYDIIIIGTGAGGGTVAHELASRKKVLILERGQFLPREKDNWNPTEVYQHGRVPLRLTPSLHRFRKHNAGSPIKSNVTLLTSSGMTKMAKPLLLKCVIR